MLFCKTTPTKVESITTPSAFSEREAWANLSASLPRTGQLQQERSQGLATRGRRTVSSLKSFSPSGQRQRPQLPTSLLSCTSPCWRSHFTSSCSAPGSLAQGPKRRAQKTHMQAKNPVHHRLQQYVLADIVCYVDDAQQWTCSLRLDLLSASPASSTVSLRWCLGKKLASGRSGQHFVLGRACFSRHTQERTGRSCFPGKQQRKQVQPSYAKTFDTLDSAAATRPRWQSKLLVAMVRSEPLKTHSIARQASQVLGFAQREEVRDLAALSATLATGLCGHAGTTTVCPFRSPSPRQITHDHVCARTQNPIFNEDAKRNEPCQAHKLLSLNNLLPGSAFARPFRPMCTLLGTWTTVPASCFLYYSCSVSRVMQGTTLSNATAIVLISIVEATAASSVHARSYRHSLTSEPTEASSR